MSSAVLIPRVGVLIRFDSTLMFVEPRAPTPTELKANPNAPTAFTPTVNIHYEKEFDEWVMIPKDSTNQDGSKRGMIMFIGRNPGEETTHIRVTSITQNGRAVRGTPFSLPAIPATKGC